MLVMLIALPILIMLIIGSLLAVISGFAFGMYLTVRGVMIMYTGFSNPCQGFCLPSDTPSIGLAMFLSGIAFILLAYKAARG